MAYAIVGLKEIKNKIYIMGGELWKDTDSSGYTRTFTEF